MENKVLDEWADKFRSVALARPDGPIHRNFWTMLKKFAAEQNPDCDRHRAEIADLQAGLEKAEQVIAERDKERDQLRADLAAEKLHATAMFEAQQATNTELLKREDQLAAAQRTIAQLREDAARVQGRLRAAMDIVRRAARLGETDDIVVDKISDDARAIIRDSLASGSSTGEADKCRCGHPVSQPATHVRSKACAPPPAPEPALAPKVLMCKCAPVPCVSPSKCFAAWACCAGDASAAPASAQGTPELESGSTAWANWITGKVDALSKRVHALIQWADHGAPERAWVRAQMQKDPPQPAPVERHGKEKP